MVLSENSEKHLVQGPQKSMKEIRRGKAASETVKAAAKWQKKLEHNAGAMLKNYMLNPFHRSQKGENPSWCRIQL
jgi:hypothetical protein